MEFKITGRAIEITDAIEDYARKKTDRLPRFFDRIQSISVIVEKHNPQFEIELLVDLEHSDDIVAKGRGEDLYACIDETVDKAERQVRDHKEKLRNRKHGA
jgi:putative sigma-54 modulation protein